MYSTACKPLGLVAPVFGKLAGNSESAFKTELERMISTNATFKAEVEQMIRKSTV